jgi:hypothetical protein
MNMPFFFSAFLLSLFLYQRKKKRKTKRRNRVQRHHWYLENARERIKEQDAQKLCVTPKRVRGLFPSEQPTKIRCTS